MGKSEDRRERLVLAEDVESEASRGGDNEKSYCVRENIPLSNKSHTNIKYLS